MAGNRPARTAAGRGIVQLLARQGRYGERVAAVCGQRRRHGQHAAGFLRCCVVAALLVAAAGCTSSDDGDAAGDAAPVPATSAVAAAPTTTAADATAAPATTAAPSVTVATTAVTPAPAGEDPMATALRLAASLTQGLAQAVRLHDSEGLDAAIARYSESLAADEPLVFIAAPEGMLLAHPNPDLVGSSLLGDVGLDMFGYPFGERIVGTPASGHWVTYASEQPHLSAFDHAGDAGGMPSASTSLAESFAEGTLTVHGMSVIPHDGVVYGASVSMPAAGVIEFLMRRSGGLIAAGGVEAAATDIADDPVGGALNAMMAWHNATGDAEPAVLGFVADASGVIIHSQVDPASVGTDLNDLIGAERLAQATPEGVWLIEPDSGMRLFLIAAGPLLLGGGVIAP